MKAKLLHILTPPNPHRVVMVVGAGRGPLVDASIHAAQSVDRKIRIHARRRTQGLSLRELVY